MNLNRSCWVIFGRSAINFLLRLMPVMLGGHGIGMSRHGVSYSFIPTAVDLQFTGR